MGGWIKIDRGITKHWIWKNAEYLKWWLDILLMASWQQEKKLVGRQLVTLERGQLIASLSFLSERWGRSVPTIIKFLKLLQDDGMVVKTSSHNISILQVSNYEKYQTLYNLESGVTCDNSVNYGEAINSSVDNNLNNPVYTSKEYKEDNNSERDNARARKLESFKKDVMGVIRMEQACYSLMIDKETYIRLAEEIFSDWEFTNERNINALHFLTVMRYKLSFLKREKQNEEDRTKSQAQRRGLDTSATRTQDYDGAF